MTIRRDGPRILITRLSAVGDCVLTLPVLSALREFFADARLSWLVEPLPAQLLAGHRALDELIVARRGWLKSPAGIAETRRLLRRQRWDIVVDVQSLTKSGLAGWLTGARTRIGFASPQGRELAPWLATRRVPKTRSHVVDAYLELLRPLGIESPRVRFDLPRYPQAAASMASLLKQPLLADGFAVINPGAGWDSKVWPAERHARVAQHLGRQYRLPSLVVWAGAKERAWAEQIVAGSRGHAHMAPATTLCELVELLRAARLFVGSDTGPMHMAAAVGTPCVALFGPTSPEVCGPYGPHHVTVRTAQPTLGGMRARGGSDNSAMRSITVEDVFRACRQVLTSVDLAQVATTSPHSAGSFREMDVADSRAA